MYNIEFILTDEPSNKVFHIPTITMVKASVNPKMHHNPRKPVRMIDMVPVLQHNSLILISASKFVDANYIKFLTPKEVLIYDGNEVKLLVLGQAILPWWRFKMSGLWRVPLKPIIENEKYDTILLNRLDP